MLNVETGLQKLAILSYGVVHCFHSSVSLNNEKNYCENSEDKIAVFEKTAGLRSGKFFYLNSACQKVLINRSIVFRYKIDCPLKTHKE